MEVSRGDVVVAVVSRSYGKARPAVVVQADVFSGLASVAVVPLTSELHGEDLLRIPIAAADGTGLAQPSQAMIDKITTVPRTRIGQRIGRLDAATATRIDAALARFLGLD